MQLEEFQKKYNNFKKKPFFFKIQTLLDLIPLKPVKIARFFMLNLDAVPEKSNVRRVQIIRLATKEDIPALCLLENKPEIFYGWLNRGEHCVVAIDSEAIVGFEWFSSAETYTEERFKYKIIIPSDAIYTYNAYIKYEYRLRGIWIQFQMFIKNWMDTANRKRIIAMVDYGNNHSLNTHVRFGFRIYRDISWICFIGKNFFIEKGPSLQNSRIK